MELWTLFCATNIFRKFVSTVLFKYCTCTRTCRLLYLFPSKVLSYFRTPGSTEVRFGRRFTFFHLGFFPDLRTKISAYQS